MPLSSIPPQTNLPATNAVPAGISASPSSTKSDNFSAALTVAGKSSERKSSVAASAATGTDLPAGGNAPPLPEPVAPPVPPASVLLGIPATAAAAAVNAAAVNAAAVNTAGVNAAAVNAAAVNTAGVNTAGEVNGAKSAAAAAASASVQAQTVAAADLLASSADKAAPTALNTAWAATAASSAGAAARDAFAAATTAATAAAPAGEDASASAMAAASAAAAAGKAAIAAQAGSAATTTQDHTASLAATVETAAGGKQAAGAVALQRADGARPGAADAAAASAAATGAANSDPTRDAGSSAVGAASASTAAAAATVLDPSSTSAAQATLAAATENAAARGARDLVPQRSADRKAGVPASAAAGNADAIGGVAANAATAAAVTAPITAFAAIVNGGDKHAQVDALTATAGPALTPTSDGTGATLQLTPDTTVAAATGSTAAGSAKIDAPIGTPEFNETLANHVSWMGGNNITGATLQVSPPQLGPIELRLSIEAGHAQVWMSSHNPATLDALQASSPKLREMLSSQGFQQVSVDVSQRSFQDNSSPYSQAQVWTPQPQSDSEAAGTESRVTATAATRASLGALDAYA